MLIRQGHPGPAVPPYQSYDHKRSDARAHEVDDGIPWTVLVDHLDGRVHRDYGLLADPTFLIDRDGRVAFYNVITHAPTLHTAIDQLMELGGLGVAGEGADRRVHAMPIIAAGWPAIRRGLPQSAIDLELAMPGGALLPFLGYQARRLLAPVALRATPLSLPAQWSVSVAASVALIGLVWAVKRRVLSA